MSTSPFSAGTCSGCDPCRLCMSSNVSLVVFGRPCFPSSSCNLCTSFSLEDLLNRIFLLLYQLDIVASFFSVPCSWPETALCCFQFHSFLSVPDCFPCSSYFKTSLLIQVCVSCCVLKPTLPCGSPVSPFAVSVL